MGQRRARPPTVRISSEDPLVDFLENSPTGLFDRPARAGYNSKATMSAPRASAASAPALPKCARILAIDYGRERIGLAIADKLGLTASPLPVLDRKNRRDDIRRLRNLLEEYQVELVLVGNPVHLSGRKSEIAEEVDRFARRIEKELKVDVELRDERLTSWEAAEMLKQIGASKRNNRQIDSLAAAIVLREYLDAMRAPHQNS